MLKNSPKILKESLVQEDFVNSFFICLFAGKIDKTSIV